MAFVSDTFTDADTTLLQNHTGETGATWTKHIGAGADGEIESNRAKVSSASDAVYYASGSPATAEYDVQADVYVNASGEGDGAVLGRVDTAANTWYLAQHNTFGTDQWRLYKRSGGAWTELGTFDHTLTVGQSYAVKLEIRDAAKKVYVDGVERISSGDNAITAAGKAGLRIDGGTGTNYRLDNFTATDAGGAADPEGSLIGGKLIRGGLLLHGVLGR